MNKKILFLMGNDPVIGVGNYVETGSVSVSN
jgi:hypothetical protein